jgi:hypothetical protein
MRSEPQKGKSHWKYLGELNSWCLDNEEVPPESEPDKAFVVRFVVFFPDEQYTLDDEYETKNDQFRFFITTRRIGNGFRDADAIGNGFRESKCDCGVRGNCWFHCKKNVLKEIACVKDVKKKAALLEGICELQICPTWNF